ncbi:MAG: hypothetical protein OSB09_06375, partial [Planctomycetota bacterium]|nr:hypothetical protein [Planctomycetota bacterium]
MFRNPSWTCCGPLFLCVWIFGSTLVSGSLLAQTPDVFLFDLQELGSFGQENGTYAYSVGTTSCNIGSVELLWHANDRFHPVIGQEMYRYYDGVLEQIGVSWLKHSFCALSLDACGSCQPTDCDTLGIGCSDPYTAGLNGQQSNLGPRSQVNAFTGVFPYPVDPPMPPFVTVIDRRLQVEEALIDPALNPNTLYFVTGHYISPDDAEGGNGDNNVAYRQVTISDDPASFPLNFVPGTPTQSGQPGIQAWQDYDPEVVIEEVRVPGEGLMLLGYKVTDLGTGQWRYDYALYNMNSDRCAGAFTVPVSAQADLIAVGHRGISHHSGEPFSTALWNSAVTPVGVTWATTPFFQDPEANALRWGFMYNYRIITDQPPSVAMATVTLFKPGTPSTVNVAVLAPVGSQVDVPINLICAQSAGGIDIEWQNPIDYDELIVEKDGLPLTTLAGDATTFSDAVTAAGDYQYGVRGVLAGDASLAVNCSVTVFDLSISIENQVAIAGQASLQIPVLSSFSASVEAYDLSIEFPGDLLDIAAVTTDGTDAGVIGAEQVLVEADDSATGGYITVQVVFDAGPPFAGQELPAGIDQTILMMEFSVAASGFVDGEERDLSFIDGLGPSQVANQIIIDGAFLGPVQNGATLTFLEQPIFLRGDCNGDDAVNLADVIFGLTYLFAGGVPPQCMKACDTDDTGNVNLTD